MRSDDASPPARLIAFILPDLRIGGVERLTIDLAEELLSRGFAVDLVLMEARGEFLDQVPRGVRVIDLKAPRTRHAVLPLRRYLKAERPAAVCAAMWPLTIATLLAKFGTRTKTRVILSEHNSIVAQYAGTKADSHLGASIRASYFLADGIICTSDGVSDEIAGLAGLKRERVTTVYNPVKISACSDASSDDLWGARPGKRILAVGRLKTQKNFPLLIAAFRQVLQQQDATLALVGDGEERENLEAMIAEHGLEGRVLLPGRTLTPGDWYRGADLFVLPSDYEGFAIVLVEAMHFGLPVVSTDCPHGPAEVVGHGRWGRLVPVGDSDALARAIAAALAEPCDAATQRERAAEFSVERAATAYAAAMLGDAIAS